MSLVDIREIEKSEIDQVQFADPTLDGLYLLKLSTEYIIFINENEDNCGEVGYDEIDDLIAALRYVQKIRTEHANERGDW